MIILDLTGFGESAKDMAVSYDVFGQMSRLYDFITALDLKFLPFSLEDQKCAGIPARLWSPGAARTGFSMLRAGKYSIKPALALC